MKRLPATKERDRSALDTESRPSRDRVLKGTAWTVCSYVVGNVLRLASNLLLAGLLFPEVFALVALAGILTQGLKMFSDIGIGPSIIQSQRGEDPKFLNTAWTMQVIRGACLFVAACSLAYPFAAFYNASMLLWIVPVLALQSIVSGFNSTSLYTMSRRLNLGQIAALALGESLVKLAVTVGWALMFPSVWAIVGGILVSQVVYTAASHIVLPSQGHRFIWNREAAQELTRFGRWVFLSTAVTFFAQQSDRLLLGKLVTLDFLGVYSIALMFSRIPIEICSAVTTGVLFPLLASIERADHSRIVQIVSQARRLLLTIGVSATIGFMVLSPWLFHYAYDARYQAAVWMAPLLGVAMWFSILQISCDRALLALGDTRTLFLSNLTNFLVTFGACVAGFQIWGLPGFIIGISLGNLSGHLIIMAALFRGRMLRVSQDLGYTAVLLTAGAIGVWVPWEWSMSLTTREGMLRFIYQAAVGAIAGYVAIRKALHVLRK